METEDWLDYLPIQGEGPDLVEQEELLCFRKRGRGSMDHRIVPRLPLTAMIQRMKLLDDSVSSGKQRGSRGRARILQDRAKSSRPHGLKQKEKEKPIKREVTETIYDDNQINERNDPTYNHQWRQNDFPSLGIEHTTEGSPKKKCRSMISDSQEYKDVIVKSNEVDPEINNLEAEEPRLSFPVNKIHHSSVETVLNKPKTPEKRKE
ncbi:uncharacterized protein LOC132736892, partial [Ruditapes philippinarum]|uniref:uncharacterized protein LOC132736892 n=1 Tax=Ruditapes philippinarum TaxID=129788 RepID=UPI00295B5684